MPTLRNLAMSWEEGDRLALASSLAIRRAIKATVAAPPVIAAKPIASIRVTVLVVTVEIN